MAGHKKKRHEDHGEHPDERWLVTYADLMTLLVALFMVLFSISSVNKSKFESLQQSLQDAFSGRILPGGRSIKQAGGTDNIANPSSAAPLSSLRPFVGGQPAESIKAASTKAASAKEQKAFEALKARLDAAAQKQGLSNKIHTTVTKDGLRIRLLTDGLLFDSGAATLRPQSAPLLRQVAGLLATEPDHPLMIQGNTDSVPLHSGTFRDNLDLSQQRAGAIYRVFQADGISPKRMTAGGSGQYAPIASNATAAGRELNRRVEIVVPRTVALDPSSAASTAKTTATASSSGASSKTASTASSSTASSGTVGDLAASIRPDLTPSR